MKNMLPLNRHRGWMLTILALLLVVFVYFAFWGTADSVAALRIDWIEWVTWAAVVAAVVSLGRPWRWSAEELTQQECPVQPVGKVARVFRCLNDAGGAIPPGGAYVLLLVVTCCYWFASTLTTSQVPITNELPHAQLFLVLSGIHLVLRNGRILRIELHPFAYTAAHVLGVLGIALMWSDTADALASDKDYARTWWVAGLILSTCWLGFGAWAICKPHLLRGICWLGILLYIVWTTICLIFDWPL